MSSIVKAIQLALQLDLFSDFLLTERRKLTPTAPEKPGSTPTNGINEVPRSEPTVPPRENGNTINKRRILINNTLLEYELQRSKRRSIGFLINEDGLRITAPRWVTIAAIEVAIHEKQRWILRKLSERKERTLRKPKPELIWRDGATIPYLGKEMVLRTITESTIEMHGDARMKISADIRFDPEAYELRLYLPQHASEQLIKDSVLSWLKKQATNEFNQRLPGFAEKLNVRYHSMSLSSAATRWGSCTSQGKIRLNWRLIHFSPFVIEYVIAHELAHLKEMNHSPRFWATVESVFPDYDIARHQLRQHATSDLPHFE